MLRLDNEHGIIAVDDSVVAGIVSKVANNCFGISGMTAKNKTEALWNYICRESSDKGISVRCENNEIEVDLHIMVVYEINIPAITDSIIHKITYSLEEATGFHVKSVNIFVDSIVNE